MPSKEHLCYTAIGLANCFSALHSYREIGSWLAPGELLLAR
jgi:hypothetical protein